MLLLLVCGVPALFQLSDRPSFTTCHSAKYALKIAGCFCLAVLEIGILAVFAKMPTELLSHVLYFLGFCFAAVLSHYDHFYSRMSSSTLLLAWPMLFIAGAIRLRTLFWTPNYSHILFAIYITQQFLFVCNATLQLIGKSEVYYTLVDADPNCTPEQTANIFSRFTFTWMNSMMRLGYTKTLTMDDLWNLKKDDSAAFTSEILQKHWSNQLQNFHPSLLNALISAFGINFLFSAGFKALQDMCAFMQPQLLHLMMDFAKSHSDNSETPQPLYYGIIFCFAMLLTAVVQTMALHQYFHICFITGMRIKSCIISAVYQKSLRLSNAARQASTVGEITNLMSVDASRLADLCSYIHILWSGPFQIGMAIYFLQNTLGPSIYGGVAIMVFMIPVNWLLASKSRALQKIQMGNKDSRTKLMDEVLSGIKVIKLYAWERSFFEKIQAVRELELLTLKKIGYLAAAQSFAWSCTPFMVSFTSFATYAYFSPEPLTSTKVFVSIALFNLLQFPLAMFANVIASVIDASVSFSRIFSFLIAEEIDKQAVTRLVAGASLPGSLLDRVMVENGSFAWEQASHPVLSNISFTVSDGKMLGVVGKVGAGKSTLLSAILGDTYKLGGSVTTRGSTCYVPQTAWIINSTLRENILFGRVYHEKNYAATLHACGLNPDIAMLPGGDMTEIGERGITLSGGQKQRISIARAVYSDSDIYLFDDPLSAVDAHVGRHIFDRVFGPKGMLKKKTRIFVTHGIHFLPDCDCIMMLKNGQIAEMDKYEALLDKMGAFCALIRDHGNSGPSDTPQQALVAPVAHFSKLTKSATTASLDCSPAEQPKKKVLHTMSTEESAKGCVSWDVYVAYAKACHLPSVVGFIVLAAISQALSVFQNVFLSWWAQFNDEHQALDTKQHGHTPAESFLPWLIGYGSIGIIYSSTIVIQVIFVWIFCGIRAARILHIDLLTSILRVPQAFFDTTPLGRIINRFSKDQYTVDEVLPRCFQMYFRTLFALLSVLAVNTLGSPYYLLLAFPLGILYSYFQKFYLCTSRELKRLESSSRSPIYAHFQESLAGVASIRAYGQEQRFIRINESRIDYNQQAYYPSVSSNRWLAVRLEFIGSLIIFGSAAFGVLSIYLDAQLPARYG